MLKGKRNKIQTLYESFAGIPRDFSAAPFVFLNDDIDVSVIGDILDGLSRKGFARVVLSASAGLSVPFASDEYWLKLSPVIERAGELSMSVWLCCDYNRPSGGGARRFLIGRSDYCAHGIVFRNARHPHPHERVIGTYLTKGRSITYLTEHPARKKCLIASAAAADSPMLSIPNAPRLDEGETNYLDILNPDAVGYYISSVLGLLQSSLEKYFGNTVTGILIQSPQNQFPFPWTDSLPDLFKKKYGYDLIACLPSLIKDVGDFLTVRTDYYRLIGTLTRDYYHAIAVWARQHNLSFSATIGGEEFVERISQTQGNLYEVFSELNVPGASYRCDGTSYLNDNPACLSQNFTPKFASSIAATGKHDGALCSVWEGEGWAASPQLLKRTIDSGVSLGITTFFTRGVLSSIAGLRKRDFPPSYYVQLPYWDDINILSDYISRTCLMMSSGHSKADVLVYFPLISLWANTLGLGRLRRDGKRIVAGLNELIGSLISDHRDFNFFFEEMLDRRSVHFSDGTITIGPNRYSTLIIPWATHISTSISTFLEAARENGVNVVFVGRHPMVLGKPQSPTVGVGLTLVKDVPDLTHFLRLRAPKQLSISGDNSEKFVHQRRALPGADIYFFSYLGDERFTGTLALTGIGTPEAWDPEDGRRYLIPEFQVTTDGVRFPITFEPGRSWIYVLHSEYTDTLYTLPAPPGHRTGEFFFPGSWMVDYRSDNMLRIDNLRLIRSSPPVAFPPLADLCKDTRFSPIAKLAIAVVRAFTESAGRIFGMRKIIGYRSYTTMEREMRLYCQAARILGISPSGRSRYQLINLIKDAARYMGLFLSTALPPEGAEFEIEASFTASYIPGRISLLWEDSGQPTKIYVNGVLVSDRATECFVWDRKNMMADLSDVIMRGTNRIRMLSRQAAFPSMIPALHWMEPIVLTGDFYVSQGIIMARRETTRRLFWGKKGTGNYSGAVTYRCTFRLPKRFIGKPAILDLGDVRVACRVVLNGRDMGARLWPLYRYEVTDTLKAGDNEIEVSVTNTTENLLGTPILSGILTDPKIVFFNPR